MKMTRLVRSEAVKELFEKTVTKGYIHLDEPMSRHTSFRTGGPARVFIVPGDEDELTQVVKTCKENKLNFYIIGNGSNLLVPDEGFDGIIIKIGRELGDITVEGEVIHAGAGALLSKVAAVALGESLTGFEFAAGIPGSIGGAVSMNAGAYGGEMKDVVSSVRLMTYDGTVKTLTCEEMDFSYRHSVISHGDYIVLSADIALKKGNYDDIKAYMKELSDRRKEKQPLEYPSAGSTFKRPEGYFAGKLIMDAGLRGYKVGGAQVSEKHCGFVINAHDATSGDIFKLMDDVKNIVYEKFGVILEPEVKILK